MAEAETLLNLDIKLFLLALVALLIVTVTILSKIDYLKSRFGIRTKWDVEHELLKKTVENLDNFQNQHKQDLESFKKAQDENVMQSIRHDEIIRNELKELTSEVHDAISEIHTQMGHYAETRINDKEQVLKVQKELKDHAFDIDQKIQALMVGNMELLGDKIDQRFSKYISLDGIPENEVEEFDGIFLAYQGVNGNHTREEKYKYVKNHMKVIPVESKLKLNE